MDGLYPMMYFDGQHFYPFAVNWKEYAYGRPVVPGLGAYQLAPEERNWSLLQIIRQLRFIHAEVSRAKPISAVSSCSTM